MESSYACIHYPEIPSYFSIISVISIICTNMHDLVMPGLQVQGVFSKGTTGPSVLYMYYSKVTLSTVSYLYICRVLNIGEQKTPDPHHKVHVYIHK